MSEFFPLDEKTALFYVEKSAFRNDFFEVGEALTCKDLADGNVNLVFRVSSVKDPKKRSIIVKQALPHARRYPDFKMPLDRARIEKDILAIYNQYCDGLCPKAFHYDSVMYVNILEDLNAHKIMREGIMTQTIYENFPRDIGIFMARTLFYTSDLFLESHVKKARVPEFINPVLSRVTEDLVFTFPFTEHPTNRFPATVQGEVNALQTSTLVQIRARELKMQFMNEAAALLHGDLHTGSIMVNESETRVIDPEFGFYGPLGFDIGNVLGNLSIAYITQFAHAKEEKKRTRYQEWLLSAITTSWEVFEKEFLRLWNEEGWSEFKDASYQKAYMDKLLHDSCGFAACEMIRRTIGMAHVPELDGIEDDATLTAVSKKLIKLGAEILSTEKIVSIKDYVRFTKEV